MFQHRKPEWWTKRLDKTWRGKEKLNLGKKESRREVSKEKFSENESLSRVESSNKELMKEVAFEEKIIPTKDMMSMIGKKPTKKTRRKIRNKGIVGVSETKVEEDTPHDLGEGNALGWEIGAGEHQENGNFQDLMKALEKFKVNMPIKEMVEQSSCCMKFL